jgi:hypothetical protein
MPCDPPLLGHIDVSATSLLLTPVREPYMPSEYKMWRVSHSQVRVVVGAGAGSGVVVVVVVVVIVIVVTIVTVRTIRMYGQCAYYSTR